ncbi:MAG: hypothetical protein NPIRA04_17840 [Nitrospirales bacterium]|nr:MAG: hypothetical protein NPIRA04_17840 [Nitrospirales bacterium]
MKCVVHFQVECGGQEFVGSRQLPTPFSRTAMSGGRFTQPVQVSEIINLIEEEGLAIVPALDHMQRIAGGKQAW